jgi:UDP-3-O-[3-hydroxymyristoyl] glucosamine N-acyltransferase
LQKHGITAKDVIEYIRECRVVGNPEYFYTAITGIAPSHSAGTTDLTFGRTREQISNCKASVIICPKDFDGINDKILICVDNPRLWFLRVAKRFFNIPEPRIQIGNNVYRDRGVVIGSEGFGYERNEKGEIEKFPHIGGVIIGNDVDIGANTCIDRGSLEDTVIGDGTKIDNLVHVGHNAKIGKHVLITALSLIGGSAEIGDYATIWSAAVIKDHVRIGHHAIIGAGAVVIKDVKPYETVVGVPARNIEQTKQKIDGGH